MALSVVGFDTSVYIYFLERIPSFYEPALAAIESALGAGERVCVPTLVITEILSGTAGKEQVMGFLSADSFQLYDLTEEIALLAGELRFTHKGLGAADAVHVATCLAAGANRFITNDQKLVRLSGKLKLDVQLLKSL